jgi:hypothetical protein
MCFGSCVARALFFFFFGDKMGRNRNKRTQGANRFKNKQQPKNNTTTTGNLYSVLSPTVSAAAHASKLETWILAIESGLI